MNCKAGDTAIIIGGSAYAGKLVKVLYQAPQNNHELPNGALHNPCDPNSWVIVSLGTPFESARGDGKYACGLDEYLRPLPKLEESLSVESSNCMQFQ